MPRNWLYGITAAALLAGACENGLRPGEPTPDKEVKPAPATLHRLTRNQYHQTVRELFGDTLRLPTDLEVDTPLHGFVSIGAGQLTISPRAAEQYEAAALDIAHQVMTDPARRTALLGKSCTPTTVKDPCLARFLSLFGLRAWRRPLTDSELAALNDLLASLSTTLGGVLPGLEYTLAALLQSPHFLFRVEIGEPDPDKPGRRRYTAFEMASRLSYLLWDGPPDEQLLSLAYQGKLLQPATLAAQAERMLASPHTQATVRSFFAEYFTLGRLETTIKDKALFPQVTPALVQAMREEILRDVEDVVWTRDADYRQVLSNEQTFVNADLARLYSLPPPEKGWAQVALPAASQRGGLLGTAGFLSLNAHATMTSPTHRGKFVRQYLLCQDIPPPPAGVLTVLDPPVPGQKTTLRQRLARHREDPACAGCHERMDPIGLGLENFDAIGAYRTTEDGLPIDASAILDGVAFSGARELGQALAAHPDLALCLARQLYRHGTGHIEEFSEEPAIASLGQAFAASQFRFRRLLLDLIQSEGFRYASESDAPAPAPTDSLTHTAQPLSPKGPRS